ncbi:ribosomal protein S19 [Tanacetum coccineum]
MPRRSIWKGSFFLCIPVENEEEERSSILPEFVDCSVRIYNGKTPVRCKITEGGYQAEKAGQPLPYVPIASAARAPAPSSAGEASPDLRSANSVRIDFIQERRRPWNQ